MSDEHDRLLAALEESRRGPDRGISPLLSQHSARLSELEKRLDAALKRIDELERPVSFE